MKITEAEFTSILAVPLFTIATSHRIPYPEEDRSVLQGVAFTVVASNYIVVTKVVQNIG